MGSSPVDVDVHLGDNDGQAPLASSTESEVNAIFADMENDADLSYKPLAPSLDLDALRREADARHARNIEPMTSIPPNILAGSSSMLDTKGKNDAKEDERKEKRIMPKLDEARLLGPDGFPKLIKDTKHFKPKGKGHEVRSTMLLLFFFFRAPLSEYRKQEADLNRLLRIYQFWTHKLYPKTQFRDTVERVEKLCHSRRMHVRLPSSFSMPDAQRSTGGTQCLAR
jgi:replication fork protection complex subunit Csm3/Swi3